MTTRSLCHELSNKNQIIFSCPYALLLLLAASKFIPLQTFSLSIFEAIFSVFLQLFLESFFIFIKLESHNCSDKSIIGFLISNIVSISNRNLKSSSICLIPLNSIKFNLRYEICRYAIYIWKRWEKLMRMFTWTLSKI